jgi:hypothetical protein
MISISDRLEIIREAHDMNLHHGFTKTLEALRGKVWPGKTKDVNDFILSCSCCKEKDNRKTTTLTRIPGYMPDARYPLEIVAIDLFEFGNAYYLTIMDTYSRFESCLPLDSKSREAVEGAFSNWIKEFGKPISIISDRGSEFDGIYSFGIHHRRTASYRPMDNGMIERSHQELAKLSRIHKSTPDKVVHFMNNEDVMRSFAEIIPDFAKPDIKRMDSVLVYVERRGRAKDESPWTGPLIVEEILDARTLKLSDGSEVDVSNVKKASLVECPVLKLKGEILLDWATESKLDLTDFVDVFGTQGKPFSYSLENPWNSSWKDRYCFILCPWQDISDVYLKILSDLPEQAIIVQPKIRNQEYFKLSELLPTMKSKLDMKIWSAEGKFPVPVELILLLKRDLSRILKNSGGMENYLKMLRSVTQ